MAEKKKKLVSKHKFYKAEGNKITRLRKVCQRCGSGTFMAEHKDRWYCGRCHYTIFKEAKK